MGSHSLDGRSTADQRARHAWATSTCEIVSVECFRWLRKSAANVASQRGVPMSTSDDAATASLMAIATGGKESERIALAKDPATPDAVIQVLAQDKSLLVREQALKRVSAVAPGVAGTSTGSRPTGPAVSNETVASTARRALSIVDNLNIANTAVVVLSLLGAAFLVYLGAQSVCADGSTDCFPSDRRNNPVIIVMGVALAAGAIWVYFIARVIGIRVELAARQADQPST